MKTSDSNTSAAIEYKYRQLDLCGGGEHPGKDYVTGTVFHALQQLCAAAGGNPTDQTSYVSERYEQWERDIDLAIGCVETSAGH